MARVKYGQGVSELQGRIGGTIFSRNVAGPFACNKSIARYSLTPRRSDKRPNLSPFLFKWSLAGLAYRTLWNDYAAIHFYTDPFNTPKKISGYSWFTHCHYYLHLISDIWLDTPPVTSPPVQPPPFWITYEEENWAIQFHQDPPDPNLILVVKVTPPVGVSSIYFKNHFRFISLIEYPVEIYYIITSLLDNYFGFQFPIPPESIWKGFNVGCLLYYFDPVSGLTGPGRQMGFISG